MQKHNVKSLVNRFLTPVLLILLGLVLLVNPDSASAFLAKFLGWIVLAVGIGLGVAAMVEREGRAGKLIGAILCLSVGGWLVKNPLVLAAGIGRFVGLLLVIRGLGDILDARKQHMGLLMPVITTALGVILIALPMTTSRVALGLCGLAVLVVGVVMFVDRLKGRGRLNEPEDPNIIDAL